MSSVVFTDALIQRLKPNPNKQFDRFDSKVSGFGIRVSYGGAKAFFLAYRMGGRTRRLTIGRYPSVSLSEGRTLARKALSQVAKGVDPATEKIRARHNYETRLFPFVVDDYIENYAKRKTKSWHETERILRQEFGSLWRNLPINQITRHTINSVLDAIVKRGAPSAANHAFADLRRGLNWCVERGYIEHSPCAGMKSPSNVVRRDRVLNADELVAIWRGAENLGWPFGSLIQLLILTGQRRSEVGGLCWHHLNLQHRIWTQPAECNKSGRVHLVALSSLAVQIIQAAPRVNDEFILPARGRNTPLSGFSKWKRKLDDICGVRDWTLHDLRRTASTGMAAIGISPHVIEAVLNHRGGVLGGVAGTYNRFEFLDERRYALELWSQHIENIISKPRRRAEALVPVYPHRLPLG